MMTTYILGAIALVLIGSVTVSGIVYARQQDLQKRKQMVRKLIAEADEAIAFQSLLLKIDERFDILIKLQNIVVAALKKAQKITPADKMIQHNLSTQAARLDEFNHNKREQPVVCWSTSDAELVHYQTRISQLSKLLDIYRNRGDLSIAEHQAMQTQLKELQFKFTHNSLLYQADTFAEQNNITSYQLYIKQAIQTIRKSDMADDEKNTRIKELSERINSVKETGRTEQLPPFIKINSSNAA